MAVIKNMRYSYEDEPHVPYVGDDGIYAPCLFDKTIYDQLLISKEMFIEAYNKWIKGEENNGRSDDYQ